MLLKYLFASLNRDRFEKLALSINYNFHRKYSKVEVLFFFVATPSYNQLLYLLFFTSYERERDRLFLAHQMRISEILPWDRKSYLTHAILLRARNYNASLKLRKT